MRRRAFRASADVQRISIENSWMRGPTDTDWFYCYDACTAPLAAN